MSHSYNKAKKARRKSKPKHGHQLREREHTRRPTFHEKILALVKMK